MRTSESKQASTISPHRTLESIFPFLPELPNELLVDIEVRPRAQDILKVSVDFTDHYLAVLTFDYHSISLVNVKLVYYTQ